MGPPPAPGTRGSRGVFVVSRAPRQVRVSILGRAFVLAALALLVSSAPGAALNPDGSLESYVRDVEKFTSTLNGQGPKNITPADLREYFITYKHQDTPPLEIG